MPGVWEAPIDPWPNDPNLPPEFRAFQATHLIHLRTGKFLVINNDGRSIIWDPATGDAELLPWLPFGAPNLFCSGHCALSDGRILMAGGQVTAYGSGSPDSFGPRGAVIFDPGSDSVPPSWTLLPEMCLRRWYPTCTALPDERVLVTSGRSLRDPPWVALDPELFTASGQGGSWEMLPRAARRLPLYPRMFVKRGGDTFYAGPGRESQVLTTSDPSISWWLWRYSPNPAPGGLGRGSAVIFGPTGSDPWLPCGRVLKVGGGTDPEQMAEAALIDLSDDTPEWVQVASLNFGRRNLNLVPLPDGTIVCIGGNRKDNREDPVYEAELWDAEEFDPANPRANPWKELAAMTENHPRWYHSSAALLRDGRVFAAGGDLVPGVYRRHSAQIYRPAYFDNPDKPAFSQSDPPPEVVENNFTFPLAYTHPQQKDIWRVCLIKLAAVTHSFDQDLRCIAVPFEPLAEDELTVHIPDADFVPPGYYMLWIVDEERVPCAEAVYVRVVPQT